MPPQVPAQVPVEMSELLEQWIDFEALEQKESPLGEQVSSDQDRKSPFGSLPLRESGSISNVQKMVSLISL